MAAAQNKPIAPAVICHAFNKTGDLIALSPNSNEVYIYATNGSEDCEKWEQKWVLSEHGGLISGIDWNPESNQIVTCGHDRNAYVWTYDAARPKELQWKPALVILRINRAATAVKWSPSGNKFAVTSGAKLVPICYYEKANDWWICKMVKKHKSTVLSVSWCPNNKFIVTGSSDNKCRIFSTYLKKLDNPEDDGFGALWPDQHKFGECLAEFDQAKSWVHSVAWSPNGFRLAFAGHASTVNFVQLVVGAPPIVQTVQAPDLPFLSIAFLSDDALVGAGYSCNPTVFVASGSEAEPQWAVQAEIDKASKTEAVKAAVKSTFSDARKMWADNVNKGASMGGAPTTETTLSTRHQNTITCIWKNKPGLITTSGVDGRILFWDLAKYGVDLKALKIA